MQWSWQLPTFPNVCRVSSAQSRLTSGFGKGPGGSTTPSHHYHYLHILYFVHFIEEANPRFTSVGIAGFEHRVTQVEPEVLGLWMIPPQKTSTHWGFPQWNAQTFRILYFFVIILNDMRRFTLKQCLKSCMSYTTSKLAEGKPSRSSKLLQNMQKVWSSNNTSTIINNKYCLIFLWTLAHFPKSCARSKIISKHYCEKIDFLGSQ